MATPPKPVADTIHEPLDVYNDPKNATVDIVAVPGLGANPVKSWQWNGPGSSFNWITDLKRADNKENASGGSSQQAGLAYDCPTARVLLYNYASAYQGPWKIKQYIVNIATKLLLQLQAKREQNIRRPLVFLGHSMGGLVIAKALVIAEQQREKFPDMYECISGCLFFGTPFDGAPVADIAKEWAVINEKLGLAINSKLIDLLTPGNESLRELKHDFVRSVNKLAVKSEIYCFYEQKSTHWEALVAKLASQDFSPSALGKLSLQEYREFVSRDSATLPGVGDRDATGLARTHRDLVRFESAKDPEYQVVKVPLKRIVNAAVLITKGRFNSTRLSAIDRTTYHKILKALDGAEVQKKYKALQQRASSSSWIVGDKEPEYIDWLDAENGRDDYLWIHGQEGRGKGGAAVSIIQEIEKRISKIEESTDKAPHLLAYFFCDETTDYCTAEDVVKSLIRQLCVREEILATYAGQFIEKKLDNTKLKASLSIERLWQSLQEMLTEGTIGTIYIVINNFHLLQDNPSTLELYSSIKEGVARAASGKSNRVRTKWLITSRSRKAMEDILGFPEVRKIDLDDPNHRDQKRAELQKYAWTKAEDLRKEKNYTRALAYFAGSIIGNRAGNTKWIDVAAVRLAALPANSSEIKVQRSLEHVPHDYDALLNDAWSSILRRHDEDMEAIKELLRALVLTYQDPTEKELLVLAGHPPEDIEYQTKIRAMIEKCRPMITVKKSGDDTEIGFVNADAKSHLLTHSEELLNVGEEWIEWQHGILALRCFSYIIDVLEKVPPEESTEDKAETAETTEKPAEEPEVDVSKPEPQADLGAELGTVVADTEAEVTQESPSTDDHSDSDANDTEDKPSMPPLTLAYPTKYWLRHASDENRDIARILTLEKDFWEPKSRLRLLWLREYNKLTGELEGFLPDTWTGLHVAAFIGFTKLVVALIEAGYQDELHEYDSLINTPLHLASYYDKAETVESLLKAGSKVNDMGPDGLAASPLAMAAYEGRITTMKKLILWGADVNAIDKNGPLLNAAIISGSAEAVKLLLQNNVRLNYEWQEVNVAPLAMSAYYSDLSMFNTILEEAKDTLSPAEYGKGLIWAAAAGNMEVLKRLLPFDQYKESFQRALKCASVESNWEIVLLILKNDAAQGLDCDELFHEAATNSDDLTGVLKAAWDNTAGTISKEVLNDCLYQATDMEKEPTVRLLLELGAGPNATGDEYGNALTAAAYDGTDQIVEALLAAGAEVNSSSGYALQAAAAQGHEKVVQILLDHGANIDDNNEQHSTALQAACNSSHLEVVKLLLDRGANPNLGGGPYTRPIFGAIFQGGPDILDRLLEAEGLELDIVGAPDQLNSTPLYAAAFCLPAEKMNALIDRGATIDFADQDGDTALIAAAYVGDAACLKLLLERGADFLHISQSKGTALEIAARNGHKECVDLLLARAKIILRGLKTASEAGDEQARELIMQEKNGRREAMAAEAEAEAKAQAEAEAAAAAAAVEDTEQVEPAAATSGQETAEPEVVEDGESSEKAACDGKDDTGQQPVAEKDGSGSGDERTGAEEYPTPQSLAASDSGDVEVPKGQANGLAEVEKNGEEEQQEADSEAE